MAVAVCCLCRSVVVVLGALPRFVARMAATVVVFCPIPLQTMIGATIFFGTCMIRYRYPHLMNRQGPESKFFKSARGGGVGSDEDLDEEAGLLDGGERRRRRARRKARRPVADDYDSEEEEDEVSDGGAAGVERRCWAGRW